MDNYQSSIKPQNTNELIFLDMYLEPWINVELKNKNRFLFRVPNTGFSGKIKKKQLVF